MFDEAADDDERTLLLLGLLAFWLDVAVEMLLADDDVADMVFFRYDTPQITLTEQFFFHKKRRNLLDYIRRDCILGFGLGGACIYALRPGPNDSNCFTDGTTTGLRCSVFVTEGGSPML